MIEVLKTKSGVHVGITVGYNHPQQFMPVSDILMDICEAEPSDQFKKTTSAFTQSLSGRAVFVRPLGFTRHVDSLTRTKPAISGQENIMPPPGTTSMFFASAPDTTPTFTLTQTTSDTSSKQSSAPKEAHIWTMLYNKLKLGIYKTSLKLTIRLHKGLRN